MQAQARHSEETLAQLVRVRVSNPNPNPNPNQVRELPLILEFGAGSAELVPVVRRLGFGGAFLVYDLPPMLLLQVRP